MLLSVILVRGIKESARTNNIMVLLKIIAILVFVGFAAKFIHPANYHPFAPNGWPGILTGGSIVFFTYIGFDSVSTAAEECKSPQRDLPIGIIATLVICTILYIAVVVVLTGFGPVGNAGGRCRPGGQHAEETPFLGGSPGRADRRTHGNDLFLAGFPAGPGARVVCDVARWPLSQNFWARASAISDT